MALAPTVVVSAASKAVSARHSVNGIAYTHPPKNEGVYRSRSRVVVRRADELDLRQARNKPMRAGADGIQSSPIRQRQSFINLSEMARTVTCSPPEVNSWARPRSGSGFGAFENHLVLT